MLAYQCLELSRWHYTCCLAETRLMSEMFSIRTSRCRSKTWTKPLLGWVKINIDAACDPVSDSVAVGCVVRDANGLFLRSRSRVIRGARSPREAEALSMREALSWINRLEKK